LFQSSVVVLILSFFPLSWRCWEKCLDNSADTESVSVMSILMRIDLLRESDATWSFVVVLAL